MRPQAHFCFDPRQVREVKNEGSLLDSQDRRRARSHSKGPKPRSNFANGGQWPSSWGKAVGCRKKGPRLSLLTCRLADSPVLSRWVPNVRPPQAGLHGFIKKLSEFAGISASLIEEQFAHSKARTVA